MNGPRSSTSRGGFGPRMYNSGAALALAGMIVGCGDGSSGASGDEEGGTGGETGGGVADLPWEPVPARGIGIDKVEVNQGVAVLIYVDGQWVTGPERNAPLVGGRDSIVRAYWRYGPEFSDRMIEARLEVEAPGGVVRIYSDEFMVEDPSVSDALSRTFWWPISAEEFEAGSKFSVSLWETSEAWVQEPDNDDPPRAPAAGNENIGVEASSTAMELVIVPLHANWPGCQAQPDLSESTLSLFENMMFMKNPLQEISITVDAEPIVLTAEPANLYDLFGVLGDRRETAAPGPQVYYYGLLDPCAAAIDGAGGMSPTVVGPTMEEEVFRMAVGLSLGYDPQFSANTLTHEIGHIQGLEHVACDFADTPNPGTEFPHADGSIGVWGFGIRDAVLRNPAEARDYMSYCYAGNWSSDWTWFNTYYRAQVLTSWGTGDVAPNAVDTLLAVVDSTGVRDSWIAKGLPAGEAWLPGARHLEFVVRDANGVRTPLSLRVMGLSEAEDAFIVSAAVPVGTSGFEFAQEGRYDPLVPRGMERLLSGAGR